MTKTKRRLTLDDIALELEKELDYYDGWKRDDAPEVASVAERLATVRAASEEIKTLKLERRSLKKMLEQLRK